MQHSTAITTLRVLLCHFSTKEKLAALATDRTKILTVVFTCVPDCPTVPFSYLFSDTAGLQIQAQNHENKYQSSGTINYPPPNDQVMRYWLKQIVDKGTLLGQSRFNYWAPPKVTMLWTPNTNCCIYVGGICLASNLTLVLFQVKFWRHSSVTLVR